MGEGFLVVIGVVLARQRAKARRAANDRLIELFPKGARPHEGLVIEPRAQEIREEIVDRKKVPGQRTHVVLAVGVEPVVDFLHRGANVRHLCRAAPDLDQGIGLFRARGQNTARAVILERPAHQPDARREQRRGERVALEAGISLPVEAECHRGRHIDPAFTLDPHQAFPRLASAASSTRRMSWVVVSRSTTSQLVHPAW